jgi:hypothetical protein
MVAVLLIGGCVFLASLLSYGVATALILNVVVRLVHRGGAEYGFVRNVAVMMIVTLITAASHLVQIALWAVVFLVLGQMANFEEGFYFSAVNYTALGYGDIVLAGSWRLLGPLEAIDGILFFGLSTAVMFAVMSRLITNRLHHQFGQRDAAPDGAGSK